MVTQVIAIIGCVCTVSVAILTITKAIGGPLMENTKTMTKLTEAIESLTAQFSKFETNNHEAHKRIHERIDEEAKELLAQDKRIIKLEEKVNAEKLRAE